MAEQAELADELEIGMPDDFHLHLRDGAVLEAVAPISARQFSRALVMPNLIPPVTTVKMAHAYRERILAATGNDFKPLMTLYLTSKTTKEEIRKAAASPHIVACKLYPANATTNSTFGVVDIGHIHEVLLEMESSGLVLCVHGECVEFDMFDREARFVTGVLPIIQKRYPRLRVVLEHATTAEAAEAVCAAAKAGKPLAATLTPHHLMHTRRCLFADGKLRPDMFCLPILKTDSDRDALLRAATGEHSANFFAGTDSAPHTRENKLCIAVCAGIFCAPAALAHYASAFDSVGGLHKLRAFLSVNGAKFYGLPVDERSRRLRRGQVKVPAQVQVGDGRVIRPLGAEKIVEWSITE